jgi:hypothetical protein
LAVLSGTGIGEVSLDQGLKPSRSSNSRTTFELCWVYRGPKYFDAGSADRV